MVYSDNGLIILWKQINPRHLEENDSYFHVSNDYGHSFMNHRVVFNDKPVYISEMESIGNYIFCQSSINTSYFYFDKNLQFSHYSTRDKDSTISVHPKYINYISKRDIIKSESVSDIL
ncbi:hypothetical protein RF11_03346 [Thelohanellus kitauei]|uniref:Sortilin N-terminal domain-containing protein n=1 Tax=Thelohanellus kitauei TaxID=669202 RepID=A0A0C2MDB9_THEKT|nr:hypothetical protein RF11_03346 [Thelohanellus kitauei]